MTSWKAYILTWVVWWQFKGSFQSAQGLRDRVKRERTTQDPRPPTRLRKRLIVEEREVAGRLVYDVSPKSETPTRARVLYAHGGAFLFAITPLHWDLIATLAERLQAVVTVPMYPLGPEHKLLEVYDFLQPIHDAMAASRDATPFSIVGDSAGGTIALVLSQQALQAKRPLASRVVLITPAVDATMSNPEARAAAATDPWMDVPGIEEIPRLICPELDTRDPRVSPLYGDLAGLPPMLVFVAGRDLLAPDTRRLVDMARAKDREVVLVEGEGMLHVWPILPIPEAVKAKENMIEFLEEGI